MKTSHGEYRQDSRTGIRIPVTVEFAEDQLQTSTLNLSFGGIRLKKPKDLSLEPGQQVQVRFDPSTNFIVPAKVVHVGEDHLGLKLLRTRLSGQDFARIIRTAPAWQRARVAIRRALWTGVRRFGMLTANTWARPLLLRQVKPTFLFAVYGSLKDVRTYYTPAMERVLPTTLIGGVIRNRDRRGLLIASKYLENELAEDSDKVRHYIQQLREDFPSVERIALVGRLPNFVMKAGLPIADPFVDGSMGTRYMIWDVARQMLEMPEYRDERSIIVLGGAGRIGSLVCEDLLSLYPEVIGFDPRYQQEQRLDRAQGTILRTADPARLAQHRLFIALTHHGDVLRELAPHLPAGGLIGDDTHPCISLEVRDLLAQRQVRTLKIVLSHHQFSMWPRMPAWNNRDIPGCLVEALVLLEHQQLDVTDFNSFRDTAREIGFHGRLIKPLDE